MAAGATSSVPTDKEPSITMADTEAKKDTPSADTETEVHPGGEGETMKAEAAPIDDATVEEQTDSSSPVALTEADDKPKESCTKDAVEEMTRGMVYASLAITDDKEDTLKKVRQS